MVIGKETERTVKMIKLPNVPCSSEYSPKGLSAKAGSIKDILAKFTHRDTRILQPKLRNYNQINAKGPNKK